MEPLIQPPVLRRDFLRIGSLSTLALLTSRALGLDAAGGSKTAGKPAAKSLIVLWLDGGPSQFETFDPHPESTNGGPTKAIQSAVKEIKIAHHYPRLAEKMADIALVRSMVTKEGDHERARYLMKTGYRPNPSVQHPSLGAICAASLDGSGVEIPRYVSMLANDRMARGGYLGEEFDPFQVGDPATPPQNIASPVDAIRFDRRLKGARLVEQSFGRDNVNVGKKTLQEARVGQALSMMRSAQLDAFRIDKESHAVRSKYGDTAFGRGCLAARRLIEVGVRCVEVQLGGWDTHTNNFEHHAKQAAILDPAFSALIDDLRERGKLDSTMIVCTGEFGRTPKINGLDGRDHWNTGFSVALAGGGLRGGTVVGKTDPDGIKPPDEITSVDDLYATVLDRLGIDPATEHPATLGRPIKLSEGKPLKSLIGY